MDMMAAAEAAFENGKKAGYEEGFEAGYKVAMERRMAVHHAAGGGRVMEENKIPEEIAKFLEDAIGLVLTYGADKIAVAAIKDDKVITSYHNCVMGDKITIAGFIQMDANEDFLKVNAGRIKGLLENAEEEE